LAKKNQGEPGRPLTRRLIQITRGVMKDYAETGFIKTVTPGYVGNDFDRRSDCHAGG